jgi:hypothetical protein
MSFRNPTLLTLGLTGSFAGHRYRVAGRVVMGVLEAGGPYYWNEFNLVDNDGKSATLVYEETAQGGEWRLFTLFEPASPLTPQEALAKQVGDTVNLDGQPMRVTLLDQSHVYHIEGEAPEGVEVGDVARYFNAEGRGKMIVVSWTGDEVEFYHGMNLPRGAVAAAFGLARETPSFSLGSRTGSSGVFRWVPRLAGVLVVLVAIFAIYASCGPHRPRGTPPKPKSPASRLAVGWAGTLDGQTYRISRQAVVEVAEVGLRYDRHEYDLLDEQGGGALLIDDARPGAQNWFLFIALKPDQPLTPVQAAAKRLGDTVEFDAWTARVTDLFRTTIGRVQAAEQPAAGGATVFYGFTAQSGTNRFLVRWNETGLTLHHGKAMPEKLVMDVFGKKSP